MATGLVSHAPLSRLSIRSLTKSPCAHRSVFRSVGTCPLSPNRRQRRTFICASHDPERDVEIVAETQGSDEPGLLAGIGSLAVWFAFAGYIGWVYFSTPAPGNPVWATSQSTIQEFLHETISLWYINPILAMFGKSLLPDFPEHPAGEALFTFIVTWDILLWPAIAADRRNVETRTKLGLWCGSLALLTAFIMPYVAIRWSKKVKDPKSGDLPGLPGYSPVFGIFGLLVFAATIAWVLFGRPEFGDIPSRLDFALNKFATDRVFYALSIDCALYTVFQFILMQGAPLKYRVLPYLGLGLWLLEGKKEN